MVFEYNRISTSLNGYLNIKVSQNVEKIDERMVIILYSYNCRKIRNFMSEIFWWNLFVVTKDGGLTLQILLETGLYLR